MKRIVCRYSFRPDVPMREVEETLHLSLYGAEGIHGAARVRLDAGYAIDEKARTLVVDASTAVGETVVQLFTGYVGREFGEDAFLVERVVSDEPLPPQEGPQPAGVTR